ncbi:MAG: secretin and TonB N-terminal domain-containing protein [Opitutaceae bacterium]
MKTSCHSGPLAGSPAAPRFRGTLASCFRPVWPLSGAVAILALLFAALLVSPTSAADVARRNFNIAAADAPATLKVFMEQSGQEIVYPAAAVRGTKTNEVKGQFTPKEALDRMLAGTNLIATQAPGGILSVTRAADPNAPRAAQTRSDRPVANPRIDAASGSKALPPSEKDAIVLSPFEVTTDKDTGFAAAGSLAGGRLAGELRDTPVAYSVMTREFIDALGVVDLFEASEWSTGNTERLGTGNLDLFGNTGEYMTRGFISVGTNTGALTQRNFFPASNYGDSYNLERYDFGRGPNSILFGNGSLAGVSSSTTKRAKTDREFQTIKTSYGSWEYFRSELDVNQPLLDPKAAVRLSLLWQDSIGCRMNEFDNRRGAFLASTLKPF